MKTRTLGILSLVCLVGTVMWLVLVIWGAAIVGPLDTFERVLTYVEKSNALFYLTYLNAAMLVTIPAIVLMTGLCIYCKPEIPNGSVVALIFVPIYGAINLFVYLSQVTIVPLLVDLRHMAEYQPACDVLLRLTIQQWPESGVAFFNGLAYAILGMPSIILGIALCRHPRLQRVAGVLLALNGVACILAMVGALTGSSLLGGGTLIGGVLFLLALFAMSVAFLREA